ncbi:MAG: septum formation initiator family protein [Clostridia bacterium]|nr:septum formation initiator family protein [Clostridia bacterium]
MKRRPKKDKSIILRLFVLLVCGYFTVTLATLWGDLNDSIKELDSLKQQLSIEQNEVKELKEILKDESNVSLIEKAARERLGFIYSNEQVFVDISGE